MRRKIKAQQGKYSRVSEGVIRTYSLRTKGLLPGILRIKDKRVLGVVNALKKFSIFLRCAQNEFWRITLLTAVP